MTLADKIVVLRDGRIEQVGSPIELYETPANGFVAQFIGSPKMNFFNVPEVVSGAEHGPDAATFIGIRPEHMQPCDTDAAIVQGRLELIENLGEYVLVHLIGETGNDFIVKMEHAPLEAKGELMGFTAPVQRIHRFDKETGLRQAD